MKIRVKYIAEDGKFFDDPLKCQEYEKNEMGVIPGSVAALRHTLEKMPQDNCCSCIFFIKGKPKNTVYSRVTMDLEPYLGSYVNVADLEEDKRRLVCTISKVVSDLGEFDKDMPACGMMIYSDNIHMGNVSIFQSTNPECWEGGKEL